MKNELLIIGLGAGVAYGFSKLIGNNSTDSFANVTLSNKQNRIIIPRIVSLNDIPSNEPINQLLLELPKTTKQFYSDLQKNQNLVAITRITQQYYTYLLKSERLSKVPAYIMASTIFAESGGNANIVSSAGAIGLTQIKPQTANDTIIQENIKGRLTTEEKTIIRKYIGSRLDNILRMKYLSHNAPGNNGETNFIKESDLKNPELSIIIGSMLLGLLIDQHIENGKIRLEKSMLRYGRGYFYKPKGANFEEVLSSVKKYPENYYGLIKYFGKNGLFETAIQAIKQLS